MKASVVPDYLRSYLSRAPSYLILYVTSRCNMSCEFCFYSDSLNAPWKDGLSLEEITRVAKSLKHCLHVVLTGGEPFLRADLAAVIRAFVTHARTRSVTIPTNGTFTDRTVAVLEEALRANPHVEIRVNLSIDALGARHDELRGSPGAFERAERTYQALKKLRETHPNLSLGLTTVVSRRNKGHLTELFDYSSSRLPTDGHLLLLARGRTRREDAKEVSGEEYDRLSGELERTLLGGVGPRGMHSKLLEFVERETRASVARAHRGAGYERPCVAGGKLVVIYDSGDVYPCEILDTLDDDATTTARASFGGTFRLGNVRESDFDLAEILDSDRARLIRKHIADSRCACTFECAIGASIVFNPKELLKSALRR